jgi:hypothetical protein
MLPQEMCCDMVHELHKNRSEKLFMASSAFLSKLRSGQICCE